MNTHSFTHYQTSFRVRSKTQKDTFRSLQGLIYAWLKKKERDERIKQEKSNFFSRCEWKNLFATRSSIATNHFLCDDFRAWALRYAELDRDLGQKRFWYTDIGLKDAGEEVILYARVSYARNYDDLTPDFQAPQTTVPGFIRAILSGDYEVYSQKRPFGLYDGPVPVEKAGFGKAIADLICSPERRYPLVVFNGGGDVLIKEGRSMAFNLAGKCQVILIANSSELAEELKIYLHKDLAVRYGTMRVYFPIYGQQLTPKRHRYYQVDDPDFEEQRKGVINGLLRNHILLEDGCIQNISEIGRLITFSQLSRLSQKNPENEAEISKIYSIVGDIEKERDTAKRDAEFYLGQYQEIEEELNRAKADNMRLSHTRKLSDNAQAKLSSIAAFSSLPKTLVEVVSYYCQMYSDVVEFADNAVESAKDYTHFRDLHEAWEMFYHICTTLHDIKFNASGTVDLEKAFRDKAPYDLGMSEGSQTKQNKALMGLRCISHKGKEYEITPHVKWGRLEPKMLRIHFAFDEEARKIIIGYVGPHIPNATSRSIK